jgi:hypothetical protein
MIIKSSTASSVGSIEVEIKEQAPLLSPFPLPSSSVLQDTFIDNIINAVLSTPSLKATSSLSSLSSSGSLLLCDSKSNNKIFDEIDIRTGNGYMTLSQVQRLVDAVTNISNISRKHSTSTRELSLRSSQPLIFDNLNTSNATSVSLTGSSSHLKVTDGYMINSIFELIVKMSRWVLPRSSPSAIDLPRLLVSSHQLSLLKQRCINTFGSLLTTPYGGYTSPLSIMLGKFDMEPEFIDDD